MQLSICTNHDFRAGGWSEGTGKAINISNELDDGDTAVIFSICNGQQTHILHWSCFFRWLGIPTCCVIRHGRHVYVSGTRKLSFVLCLRLFTNGAMAAAFRFGPWVSFGRTVGQTENRNDHRTNQIFPPNQRKVKIHSVRSFYPKTTVVYSKVIMNELDGTKIKYIINIIFRHSSWMPCCYLLASGNVIRSCLNSTKKKSAIAFLGLDHSLTKSSLMPLVYDPVLP
jgi:hypothetical protein